MESEWKFKVDPADTFKNNFETTCDTFHLSNHATSFSNRFSISSGIPLLIAWLHCGVLEEMPNHLWNYPALQTIKNPWSEWAGGGGGYFKAKQSFLSLEACPGLL